MSSVQTDSTFHLSTRRARSSTLSARLAVLLTEPVSAATLGIHSQEALASSETAILETEILTARKPITSESALNAIQATTCHPKLLASS